MNEANCVIQTESMHIVISLLNLKLRFISEDYKKFVKFIAFTLILYLIHVKPVENKSCPNTGKFK